MGRQETRNKTNSLIALLRIGESANDEDDWVVSYQLGELVVGEFCESVVELEKQELVSDYKFNVEFPLHISRGSITDKGRQLYQKVYDCL